jgi:capsular exopolysaccharide synthesis family protein
VSPTIAGSPGRWPAADGLGRQGPGLLGSVWRYRMLVAITTLLAALAGYGLSLLQPRTYEATTRLFLVAVAPDSPGSGADGYGAQQAELIETASVLEEASTLLGGGLSAADLRRWVDAGVRAESPLVVRVNATAADPQDAAAIANAVGQAYQQVRAETVWARAQAAVAELEANRQQLRQQEASQPGSVALQGSTGFASRQQDNLDLRVQDLLMDAIVFGSGVEVFEEASVPVTPVRPTPVRNGVLAGALALVIAAIAAVVAVRRAASSFRPGDVFDAYEVSGGQAHSEPRSRMEPAPPPRMEPAPPPRMEPAPPPRMEPAPPPRAVPDPPPQRNLATLLGSMFLGEVSRFPSSKGQSLAGQLSLDPAALESYRFLLASIEDELERVGATSLLITSAVRGEGKTTTALQLAMAATRRGRRVVLVDADLRAQGLTRMLGVRERTGLSELALSHLDVDESVHYLPVTDELLLPVVAAGGRVEDPTSFFSEAKFRRALRRISDEAELVMIDGPPLLTATHTMAIASRIGGVVLVVDRDTDLAQVEEARERLRRGSTPLLGYVYNRSEHPTVVNGDHGPEPTGEGPGGQREAAPGSAGNGRPGTRDVGAASRGRPEDRAR